MSTYKHIFFDLDRTLWDLEKNSAETLHELYEKYGLAGLGIKPYPEFLAKYKVINDRMWDHYLRGEVSKETLRFGRFHHAFKLYGVDNVYLAKKFGEDYITHAPFRKNLFPGAHEVLGYLQKKYSLHIITNGFEEVQHIKIKHSGLEPYFTHVVTSDRAGAQKPDRRIFEYTVSLTGSLKEECIMIGDSYELDILGAHHAGIAQVYFNAHGDEPGKKCTHEITELKQLMKFL